MDGLPLFVGEAHCGASWIVDYRFVILDFACLTCGDCRQRDSRRRVTPGAVAFASVGSAVPVRESLDGPAVQSAATDPRRYRLGKFPYAVGAASSRDQVASYPERVPIRGIPRRCGPTVPLRQPAAETRGVVDSLAEISCALATFLCNFSLGTAAVPLCDDRSRTERGRTNRWHNRCCTGNVCGCRVQIIPRFARA